MERTHHDFTCILVAKVSHMVTFVQQELQNIILRAGALNACKCNTVYLYLVSGSPGCHEIQEREGMTQLLG